MVNTGDSGILRSPDGFSYSLNSEFYGESSRASIRDARDNLFAVVEYSPDMNNPLSIYVNAGYLGIEELLERDVIEQDQIHEQDYANQSNHLGILEPEKCEEWDRRKLAFIDNDPIYSRFEHIDQDEVPSTFVVESGLENAEEAYKVAAEYCAELRKPFVRSDSDDPYGESWRPYTETPSEIRLEPEDVESTLENVFERAVKFSADLLETKSRSD